MGFVGQKGFGYLFVFAVMGFVGPEIEARLCIFVCFHLAKQTRVLTWVIKVLIYLQMTNYGVIAQPQRRWLFISKSMCYYE